MQKISYIGDGKTSEFRFDFPFFDLDNIIVQINNQPATEYNIITTPGTLDSDFPYIGGSIVFATAPGTLDHISITRQLPLARHTDYQPLSPITPTLLNQDLNYLIEVIKDFHAKMHDFETRYSAIIDQESTDDLMIKINAAQNQTNELRTQIIEFSNEIAAQNVMLKQEFYSHITNCLTTVPQNITLELSDGTLTLAPGSTVYIPNGDNNFEKITTASDISTTQSNTGQYMVIRSGESTMYLASLAGCLSGPLSSRPTNLSSASGLYYCTDENKIYLTGDNGSNWYASEHYSLPLGIVSVSNGKITSIDKVFNGFGYIGSTVFALPGISGLIPNGRTPDGKLQNIISVTTSVQILTNANNLTTTLWYVLKPNGIIENSMSNYWTYESNKNLWTHDTNIFDAVIFAKSSVSNGVISNWTPRCTFCMTDGNAIS